MWVQYLKTLWAPWRVAFIAGKKEKGCIFCNKPTEQKDGKNMIFGRREKVFGMMNKYPYNSGHLLIAPYRHVTCMEDLQAEEWTDLLHLLQDSIKALGNQMHPEGYNIGFNVGKASGAGFEHIHLHIVPRWAGDTNYMPVLSETKVIPEHLNETFRKVKEGLNNI
jgi:ATP adenylyltransferase